MNCFEMDILNVLSKERFVSQRVLAGQSGYSLGMVNKSLKNLLNKGYIDEDLTITEKARTEIAEKSPKRAIILAAGFGMRMVPINMETPKALLEVNGETLIERIIRQLHEIGIRKIYIVVGFMKEQLEFLIDEYGVELIVNEQYAKKNNYYSMYLVRHLLENAYIIPCDIWARENPFNAHELYSWYMVSEGEDKESSVRVNRKNELVLCSDTEYGNKMIGITYLSGNDAIRVCKRLEKMEKDDRYNSCFWEDALIDANRFIVLVKMVKEESVIEINTFEQLRELDSNSNQLKSNAIEIIAKALTVKENKVVDIEVLKKGMTNRSFLFSCNNRKYIMRIPGEGTEQLINRDEEEEVYSVIKNKDICDNIVYMNAKNGYKITEFIDGARNCNATNENDVRQCMEFLRKFHGLKLKVSHTFDIFKQIDFYESLWNGSPSIYRDYIRTKENVFSLKRYIDEHKREYALTHIDAVPDNFLFVNEDGKEKIRLIDWEYAGMQDQDVDIAMFCIYAMYDKEHVDLLIDDYYREGCTWENRIKIYCYIASCGLLWSNWCEYKRMLGVEFGEYALRQYRYAKDYYKYVAEALAERRNE